MFEEILLVSVHSVSGLTFQFLEMCFSQACESLSPSWMKRTPVLLFSIPSALYGCISESATEQGWGRKGMEGMKCPLIYSQRYQCLGGWPVFSFYWIMPFDSEPSGNSLPVTHLWLLCEGLNYLQTAWKSQDERRPNKVQSIVIQIWNLMIHYSSSGKCTLPWWEEMFPPDRG